MRVIKQNDIEIKIADAEKPVIYSNYAYPFNLLDDRIFSQQTMGEGNAFEELVSQAVERL